MIRIKKNSNPLPKEFWNDERWARDNYQKLAQKYPDKWIAIVNRKVVASGRSIKRIKAIASKIAGRREFPIIFAEHGSHVY